MRFAPYRSNCGAATAARFLHLFKFGLVVFRRETFGDGRQSRRLPAVFFYRAAACRTATLGNRSQRRNAAGRTPTPDTPAPPGNGSCRKTVPKKAPGHEAGNTPGKPVWKAQPTTRPREKPFSPLLRGAHSSSTGAHSHPQPPPHPEKAAHASGFARDLHPLFTTAA